jgi:hypothetical protein
LRAQQEGGILGALRQIPLLFRSGEGGL